MKSSFNRFIRFNTILAFCLIAVGLLANQWLLAYLLSSDRVLALVNRIFIWSFQLFCIISGVLVYFKGNTHEERKQLVFAFIAIALIIITMEIGLRIVHFVFYTDDISDKRYLLSPYEDKEWAYEFWKEHKESWNTEYEQLLGWDRREYHSKYTNVDSNGVRKTWNPERFHCKPDYIYTFGGSTLWGTGARDDYTIPSYLSRLLNNSDYDFVVYNYGETAYVFTQEIIHLILLLREGHKPKYVIFYDGINDVYGAYQSGMAGTTQNVSIIREKLKKKPNRQLIYIGVTGIFKNNCMIYRAVRKMSALFSQQQGFQEVASKYSEKELKLLSEGISEYHIKSMELLEHLAQAYGFKYICFWQPTMFIENKLTNEESKLTPRLNDKALGNIYRYTTDSLRAKSVPHFFDISNALSDRTESVYLDTAHISEYGNQLVATKIFQIFEKEFLLHE